MRGLLRILHAYKFSHCREHAGRPESRRPGSRAKVFENLLASYNEETNTPDGLFYTAPIVDYMVDESLKAHLTGAIARTGMSGRAGRSRHPRAPLPCGERAPFL